MKKLKLLGVAASLIWLSVCRTPVLEAAAVKHQYRPASGGYAITLPPGSQELYHTSTGIRFTVGEDFMVSADLYTLPSFVSVPMRQYSREQKKEFKEFVGKVQDFQDASINEEGATDPVDRVARRFRQRRAMQEGTAATRDDLNTPVRDRNTFTYETVLKDSMASNRPYIIGRAYQPQKNIMLVVNVSAPEELQEAAKQAFKSLTSDLELGKVKYTDENILTVPSMGYEMEIPSGWRMYTMRADNVLFARSLSSVHTDGLMIREFSDDSFKDLGNSNKAGLAKAESDFIAKLTRYTPNITILNHEPITVGSLNGSLAESTDNEDLKKVFVINTYLMNDKGQGYMIRYHTDDTINYDLKLKAFKSSVESFKLLPNNQLDNEPETPAVSTKRSPFFRDRVEWLRRHRPAAEQG